MRLAIVASHPIQYYAPLFRVLAMHLDLMVFYAHRATPTDQAGAGFGVEFDWDIDLLTGYAYGFLQNVAKEPSLRHFSGCDTPEIGVRLKQGLFDAVLVLGWHRKSFIQAIVAAKRLSIPIVVRGDSQLGTPRCRPRRLAKAMAYPLLLRAFDAALYVGTRSRQYWEHYCFPQDRLFFSPHCVDTDWFANRATPQARTELRDKLGILDNAKLVLFAGKLMPFKRPFDVVESARLARGFGVPLEVAVAGAGPLESEMRVRAASLSVPIHLLGFRNQTEMPAAYAAADLLVLPSAASETWGLVCNESIACGTPIMVSSSVGCAPDLAVAGAGVVFPEGDIDVMAKAMLMGLALSRGSGAISDVSQQHSLQSASDGILAAIRSVAR